MKSFAHVVTVSLLAVACIFFTISPAEGQMTERVGAPVADFKTPGEIIRPHHHGFPVFIDQNDGQDDPTGIPLIEFKVFFAREIDDATFQPDDLEQIGTATTNAPVIDRSAGDDQNYVVRIQATTEGTVVLRIPGRRVMDSRGAGNYPSLSEDNSVYYGTPDCESMIYLYAAVWSPPEIYGYCVKNDGTLEHDWTIPVDCDVRDMQVAADGANLFYGSADLLRFIISSDGSLVYAGRTEIGSGAIDDLVLHPAGRYLYGTHSQNGGFLMKFDTNDIVPAPALEQSVDNFYIPHGVAVDSAGQNIFVGNYLFPEEVVSFRLLGNGDIDEPSGQVTTFTARPMYFAVHPMLDMLYWTETVGGSVLAGRLTGRFVDYEDIQNSGNGARQIAIDGDGDHLYVTNYNADTVTIIDIQSSGRLSSNTTSVDTEPTPEHLVLHPDGTFLYVVSSGERFGSSAVSSYEVMDGDLDTPSTVTIDSLGAYRLAIVDLRP